MKKLLLPLFAAVCLSACGFHLRGMVDIPKWLNPIAVFMETDDQILYSMIKTQFENYHIEVCENPIAAKYRLFIKKVSIQQQMISVGASTTPRQYTLTLTLEFMLQSKQGKILKPTQSVLVSRQLTINNDRVLGSNYEEGLLIKEMKQEAILQMMNQLAHHAN